MLYPGRWILRRFKSKITRYHHGENKLSPKQQDDIMQILAHFGTTDGIYFDHYETNWNFE